MASRDAISRWEKIILSMRVFGDWAGLTVSVGLRCYVRQNRTFSSDFSAKVTGVIFRLIGASNPWTLCPYAIEPSRPVLPTLSRCRVHFIRRLFERGESREKARRKNPPYPVMEGGESEPISDHAKTLNFFRAFTCYKAIPAPLTTCF